MYCVWCTSRVRCVSALCVCAWYFFYVSGLCVLRVLIVWAQVLSECVFVCGVHILCVVYSLCVLCVCLVCVLRVLSMCVVEHVHCVSMMCVHVLGLMCVLCAFCVYFLCMWCSVLCVCCV